jgi:hypothetical protein
LADPRAKDEMTSVASLDTAEKLARKYDNIKRARARLDEQWKLNVAFYKGKQWSYVDRAGRLRTLATDPGDIPNHRVRITNNQIVVGSQSLLSKMLKTKPRISATPGSSSDHDVRAAQMAEDLFDYWWGDLHLDDALEEAVLWGIIAGQGYWKITWDEHAGKAMRFMLDPQGNPIVDDSVKEAFRGQLASMGMQPQERVVYMGDLRIEVMSPFQVYLDPSAKTFKDAKYAICIHSLSADEIQTRWNKKVEPDSVSAQIDAILPFSNSENADAKDVKQVYIGYFLPSAALPNGRYVVWTKGPYEILEDSKWPYPTNDLPLVKFPGLRIPGSIYDSSVVEHAIPMQKELNRTLSQIVEYKNLTIKPRVWAPVGSLRQRLTNEPGAVYEFTPIAGLRPEIEKLPTMPPYVFDLLQDISARLRDTFNLTEVTEGTVPPNVEAGIAIDLLQEMATDRLAPTIKLMEQAIARAGQLMLVLAQKYYIEPRLLKIRGSGGSVQVQRFTQADIDGGISIHVEAGSGLPRTRAGRQARIQSFVELGILKPDQAWRELDLADMKSVSKMFQSDEDMAYREHDKLIRGIPLNPAAAQAAQQAVVQGINPQTGNAFQNVQEAEQYVMSQALAPQMFEDFNTHLEVHKLFMTSVEWEQLPQDAQQRFVDHYSQTYEMMMQYLPLPEQLPVRTSLQLKGTVGPTGAAEILDRAGVRSITPEIMAEPPLDTVVLDDIDKPNVEDTGNSKKDEAAAAAELTQMQMATQQHIQDSTHKELKHAADMRKAHAEAALAEKKLSQSDFRKKSSNG